MMKIVLLLKYIPWMDSPYAPSGASGSADVMNVFGHGSKITIIMRYSVSSVYHYRFFTCDFSVNDGSDASYWVFKHDLKNVNQGPPDEFWSWMRCSKSSKYRPNLLVSWKT